MDAIKQYMQPKWWLIAVGIIFTIVALTTYIGGEGNAEKGWGDDFTPNDVFYEKVWAANVFWVAIITLTSGFLIEGRALSILAMAISGAYILSFILIYLASDGLDYGKMAVLDIVPPMVAAVGLFLSGYLHLEEGE